LRPKFPVLSHFRWFLDDFKRFLTVFGYFKLVLIDFIFHDSYTHFMFSSQGEALKKIANRLSCPSLVINLFALQGEGESELVCVWVPLADALAPRYVLGSRGGVTCLAVHRSLLLAGADDGSVSFICYL
jgi:hypothetical protein